MKKIILLVCFLIISFAFVLPINLFSETNFVSANDYVYTGEIEHLFTHCLLAYPSYALSSENKMHKYYDRDCITPYEFKNILQSLYEKNYALIDINSVYEEINGKLVKKDVLMPKGKKPIIFSFDDVNYDHKKMKTGMIDKIILDQDGNVAAQTEITWKSKLKTHISYDNEFIPILEKFVKEHPDFSVNGAKGTICLTGYDGILGYRTSSSNKTNRQEEIEKAKVVVNKLLKTGWDFASHSYGHYHMKQLTFEQFKDDVGKWKEEVEPITGKTSVYVYPYGEWEIYENGDFTEKHKVLMNSGFKLFCGVGIKYFFSYFPLTKSNNKILFMDRKSIDGNSLLNKKDALSHLFNTSEVYDYKNRPLTTFR